MMMTTTTTMMMAMEMTSTQNTCETITNEKNAQSRKYCVLPM